MRVRDQRGQAVFPWGTLLDVVILVLLVIHMVHAHG